jgi:cytochrome o ubiquinol oxidase subunit 2
MIYAMPGMVSQLNLQADRPALLTGQSAHFSGDGFSDMNFQVHSVAPADFVTWAQTVRGGPALDQIVYANLARQSSHVPPMAFGRVDPHLFDAVASQRIAPPPGPEPENEAHAGREVANGGSH